MRSRFLLVPAAVLAVSQSSAAADLQTLEAAQQKLAPGATLTPVDYRLSSEHAQQIRQYYRVPVLRLQMKAWKVEGGGWLYLDQVFGVSDIITYVVALDAAGRVSGLEVLTCQDGYCDFYTPQWRATFTGKAPGNWVPSEEVPILSGRTMSTTHVAEGVKKILAIHARFAPGVGSDAQ